MNNDSYKRNGTGLSIIKSVRHYMNIQKQQRPSQLWHFQDAYNILKCY